MFLVLEEDGLVFVLEEGGRVVVDVVDVDDELGRVPVTFTKVVARLDREEVPRDELTVERCARGFHGYYARVVVKRQAAIIYVRKYI